MAQRTDPQLITQTEVIRNETQVNANTRGRVANMLRDIIDSKLNIADVDIAIASNSAVALNTNKRTYPIEDQDKLANIANNANNYVHPNHSGDVTSTGDGATVIANGAVTNAKQANVATGTFKGRIAAGTGVVEDLTPTQVRTLLNVENGAEVNDSALEIISKIEGVTPENRLDLQFTKGGSILDQNVFEGLGTSISPYTLQTDAVPTENSPKFINSGQLWQYEQDNPRGDSTHSNPTFSPAVYPSDQAFRKIVVRGNYAYIAMSTSDTNSRVLITSDGKYFYYSGDTNTLGNYGIDVNNLHTIITVDRQNGTDRIKRSVDGGMTFQNSTNPTTVELTGIASSGSKWAASSRIGTGNRAIYSTDDGVTWLASTTHEDIVFNDICFFRNRFWMVASDGTQRLAVSTNGGATFSGITIPDRFFGKVTSFQDKLVAINTGTGAQSRLVWTADLGTTFSQTLLPADVGSDINLIIQGGKEVGKYFYVVGNGGFMARSTNLTSWEIIATGVTTNLTDIDCLVIDGQPVIIAIGAASGAAGSYIITTY